MAAAQHTFLFADLVGFTAYTERVGDEAAADVAVAFQTAAAHLAADFGCELVKSLGDAVMVRGEDAACVVALALRIARELREEGWCPELRMGVHSGSAVRRGGDWYGSTVNVAARLADAADPGEVLDQPHDARPDRRPRPDDDRRSRRAQLQERSRPGRRLCGGLKQRPAKQREDATGKRRPLS